MNRRSILLVLMVLVTAVAFGVMMSSCAKAPRKPEAALDTPEHHVFSGDKLLDKGDYAGAQREFELAIANSRSSIDMRPIGRCSSVPRRVLRIDLWFYHARLRALNPIRGLYSSFIAVITARRSAANPHAVMSGTYARNTMTILLFS